jgi:hypothetical protein
MTEDNVTRGLAIIGPYGNVWANKLFDTPEQARQHVVDFWKKSGGVNLAEWSVAPATMRVSIDQVVMQADPIPLEPR